jgi:hypothetical protein
MDTTYLYTLSINMDNVRGRKGEMPYWNADSIDSIYSTDGIWSIKGILFPDGRKKWRVHQTYCVDGVSYTVWEASFETITQAKAYCETY